MMDEKELRKKMLDVEIGIAALIAEKPEVLTSLTQEDKDKLFEAARALRAKYYEAKMESHEGAKSLVKEIKDAQDVLGLLEESDTFERTNVQKIIDSKTQELQNVVTFDAELLFNKYLLELPLTNINIDDPKPMENERFREWFADSRVVDSNGQPLVVYHGTGGDVEEFSNFSFKLFPINYFAENKSYSEFFQNYRGGSSILFRAYLRVTNPIDLTGFELRKNVKYQDFVDFFEIQYGISLPENAAMRAFSDAHGGTWAWMYLRRVPKWLEMIKAKGLYDGFVYYENNPDQLINGKENVTKAWAIFDSNQVKTADARNTTYSLYSSDIRMKKGGKL